MSDPRHALRSPAWWIALAVLLLNDHLLKGVGPGWLTGKLSDFAGVIVAPALLATLLGTRSRRVMAGCVALVALAFTAINLLPAASRACEWLMALAGIPWRLWPDPTDLLALSMLPASWAVMQDAREPKRWLEYAGMLLGSVACVATSLATPPRPLSAADAILAQAWPRYPLQLIDPASGAVIAQLPADDYSADALIHQGVLYSQNHRRVVALDIASGRVLFDHHSPERLQPGIAAHGERLFVVRAGHHKEQVLALDARDGRALWHRAIPSQEAWRERPLRLVADGGLVLVPAGDALVALDPASGRRVWQYDGGAPLGHVLVVGPLAYAVTEQGVLHAVDLQHGQARWRHDTGVRDGFDGSWRDAPRIGAAAGNLLFRRRGRIIAIDAATAAPRWQGPEVDDMVAVGDVVVAQLGDEEQLAVFDALDGRERWRVVHDDGAAIAPVVLEADNLVLVRPFAERLYAYEAHSGRLRWRLDLVGAETDAYPARRVVGSDAVQPPAAR